MKTGARRGELCAMLLSLLDLSEGRESVWLRTAIRREPGTGWGEGDLKSHQQRRIALDAQTATVLGEHVDRCRERAAALCVDLSPDAFLFSGAFDGSTFLTPDSVTQRYDRIGARLGIATTIHKLRHYSATDLITAGVNPRTVAGRLGHGGGGTTTLKTCTAWVSEADQRAAAGIGSSMPSRPDALDPEAHRRATLRYPYERIAADLARQIGEGSLMPEGDLPSAAMLAAGHEVSLATAKRALVLAQEWGLLERSGWNSLRITAQTPPVDAPEVKLAATAGAPVGQTRTMTILTLRHRGARLSQFSAVVDASDGEALEQLLTDAVARIGGSVDHLCEYEMDVRMLGTPSRS